MATHSVFLPGKFHGQRSLVGYSPWGRKESDATERLHFHFHFGGLAWLGEPTEAVGAVLVIDVC